MATREYTTETRTVAETVVLRISEAELGELIGALEDARSNPTRDLLLQTLTAPVPTEPVADSPPSPAARYNGVTYELGVRYRDVLGDEWEFERDSMGYIRSTAYSHMAWMRLSDVVDVCAPLHRIT